VLYLYDCMHSYAIEMYEMYANYAILYAILYAMLFTTPYILYVKRSVKPCLMADGHSLVIAGIG